jgi:hypothetical protein
MHLRKNTHWLQMGALLIILLTTLSCSFLGYSLISESGDSITEVTRIVRETVIVPGSDTVITTTPLPPVVVEVTREVTRQVEVPVTRVVTAVPQPPPMDLEGVWYNPSTHSVTTIIWKGDRFAAVSVIDLDDGDVYPVTASNWNGSIIQWGYYVPDTTYNVVFTMTSLVGDNMHCEWENDHGMSGTRILERQ